MKTLRLIGTTLLMVMLAVNFTACSDDEDKQTIIEQANLIGKWQSTWEKIHKVENGKEVVTSDEAYTNGLWEFKADGTCIESYVDGGHTETSRWSLKDNKLTLSIHNYETIEDMSFFDGLTIYVENYKNIALQCFYKDKPLKFIYNGLDARGKYSITLDSKQGEYYGMG